MKLSIASMQLSSRRLMFAVLILFLAPACFAQQKAQPYRDSYQDYRTKGKNRLILGGVMMGLGALGTLTHNYDNSDGIDLTPWPVLIPVGFVFCIDGAAKLINSNKLKAGVKVEGMPALDKARIRHPVIPSLGVQVSL